jgi:hypothetical protein
MNHLNQKIQMLLTKIEEDCISNNITLLIKPYGQIFYNDIACNGYFCDIKKELVFWYSEDNLDWLLVAIHEYSHLLQFINNKTFWNELVHHNNYSVNLLDEWINGSIFSNKKITNIINNNIKLEYDCEQKAVYLIELFNLTELINTKVYIQKANAYVLFYHIVKETKQFYKLTEEPYSLECIWKAMPDTFLTDATDIIECSSFISHMKNFYI